MSIILPKAVASMSIGEMKALFSSKIVEQMVTTGFAGKVPFAGFMCYMDNNVYSHTGGTAESLGTMNGGTSEGATGLVVTGATSGGTVTKGDILTVAAVNAVNPISGVAWEGSQLRKFVCTATTTLSSGNGTIPVSPRMYSSAAASKNLPYQTIDTIPQTSAAVTLVNRATDGAAYAQNMLFHPNCFALTVLPFAKPESAFQWATATDPDLGLSISISSDYDISNFLEITRLDILFGWDTIYPELGVRMTG